MQKDDRLSIERVKEILVSSKHAVFFGGAGVSTASGIPDFRGNGGLYNSEDELNEYYLSSECLENEPEKFFRFFRNNMVFDNAKPNGAHYALATLLRSVESLKLLSRRILTTFIRRPEVNGLSSFTVPLTGVTAQNVGRCLITV